MIDEIKPSRYRQQHSALGGGLAISRAPTQEVDADGNIGFPYRVRDTVQVLRSNGTLDEAAENAARAFQAAFDAANLHGYQSPDLMRVLGSSTGQHAVPGRIVAARDDVWRAIRHLGGIGTPVAGAAWHVLGLGETIQVFAERCQLGQGRSINPHTARGLVVGACFALAGYYRA